jgi:predicted solute-binding protein
MSLSSSTTRNTPLKLRVGYADDFTTMPLIYGIDGVLKSAVARRFGTMAELRQAYAEGECEIALLPAADVLRLKDAMVIPCSSSSTLGASRLLTIFSKKIPTEIKRVLVDKEDLGGAPLAQLMMLKKLSIRPELVVSDVPLDPSRYDLTQKDGFDAYLLAGKHCFMVRRDLFAFTMDLTLAWYEYTRMPFVIHVWVTRKGLKLMNLEKELGDVARRNEGSAETATKAAERLGVSESGIRAVYEKALVTNFDPIITQAFRRYGQELVTNKILAAQPMSLYVAPVVRKA